METDKQIRDTVVLADAIFQLSLAANDYIEARSNENCLFCQAVLRLAVLSSLLVIIELVLVNFKDSDEGRNQFILRNISMNPSEYKLKTQI